jgi:hypothetical protein
MKKLVLACVAFVILQFGCSNTSPGQNTNLVNTVEDILEDNGPDIVPWEQEEPEPDPECIECAMYFCPPLDAIWRKEICMNICDDPPTLLF